MKYYSFRLFWFRDPYKTTLASYPSYDFEGAYEIHLHAQTPDIFQDTWVDREYEPEVTKRPEVVERRSPTLKLVDVCEEALKSEEGRLSQGPREEDLTGKDQLANACILVPAKPKYKKKSSSPSELLVQSTRAPSDEETGSSRKNYWTRQCVSINSSGSSLLPFES